MAPARARVRSVVRQDARMSPPAALSRRVFDDATNRNPLFWRGHDDPIGRNQALRMCVSDLVLMRQFLAELLQTRSEASTGHDRVVAPAGLRGAEVEHHQAV